MGFIGAHGVETLKRYKYSGEDRSVVAKYVLQPFWSRCVTLFPLWMPTWLHFPLFQITLTGFMFLAISALLGYVSALLAQLSPLVLMCTSLYIHPTLTQLPLGGFILPMDYFSSYTRFVKVKPILRF
ncbi:hypothetical protein PR202_ga17831 [Eleusine coracana subsp. coracana]|uniref:Uncharacterized protein n=1 Tax=Eleusine coracana subsp. coracana TaxID=191504 RepID=A0AAV5CR36_ELECO|nr:hypothetical protein PR202_ga17831 [Eleusine coracana subsp. coracana]